MMGMEERIPSAIDLSQRGCIVDDIICRPRITSATSTNHSRPKVQRWWQRDVIMEDSTEYAEQNIEDRIEDKVVYKITYKSVYCVNS